MAKIFNWFDGWKTEGLDCPACGWHGVIAMDNTEAFDELIDFRCPKCNEMLAIINFPTPNEVREHWNELSAVEKASFDSRLSLDAAFEAHHLEPPRVLRRLQLLRRWSHEEVEQVLA